MKKNQYYSFAMSYKDHVGSEGVMCAAREAVDHLFTKFANEDVEIGEISITTIDLEKRRAAAMLLDPLGQVISDDMPDKKFVIKVAVSYMAERTLE